MIQAVLTDIEGTTTSVCFVTDVLFPYARERLRDFLRTHAAEPAVREQMLAVAEIVGHELSDDEVADELERWIDEDRKATPLKALQGILWEAGYRQGDFTGHVYPDAVAWLRRWHRDGVALYVYSSGSIQAQRLLFAHSDAGDLTPLFRGYFDTTTGPKRETESYRRIARSIGLPARDILFLSDTLEELDAARRAGICTTRLVRDGRLNPDAAHREVADFSQVALACISSPSR